MPTKRYLIVQRGRMEGFLVLDCMSRPAEAIGALVGWVQAGKLKDKVHAHHRQENAPATLPRLFDGRNEGKQLLRVAH
jgi:NADPH-dependent curcumin reductase CurA